MHLEPRGTGALFMGTGACLMGTWAVMMVVIMKKKARGPRRLWLWLFCQSSSCRGREGGGGGRVLVSRVLKKMEKKNTPRALMLVLLFVYLCSFVCLCSFVVYWISIVVR